MKLHVFKLGDTYPIYLKSVESRKDSVSGADLIPAYATDVELIPEKDGYQRYFKKTEKVWDYVIDNVGTEYWDADGTKHVITDLGQELPEGALLEVPVIEPTAEELAAQARAKRDLLLDDISKRYDRYASETRLGLETTDSIEALDTYAQALRDITKQEGFPTTIEWPVYSE